MHARARQVEPGGARREDPEQIVKAVRSAGLLRGSQEAK